MRRLVALIVLIVACVEEFVARMQRSVVALMQRCVHPKVRWGSMGVCLLQPQFCQKSDSCKDPSSVKDPSSARQDPARGNLLSHQSNLFSHQRNRHKQRRFLTDLAFLPTSITSIYPFSRATSKLPWMVTLPPSNARKASPLQKALSLTIRLYPSQCCNFLSLCSILPLLRPRPSSTAASPRSAKPKKAMEYEAKNSVAALTPK